MCVPDQLAFHDAWRLTFQKLEELNGSPVMLRRNLNFFLDNPTSPMT